METSLYSPMLGQSVIIIRLEMKKSKFHMYRSKLTEWEWFIFFCRCASNASQAILQFGAQRAGWGGNAVLQQGEFPSGQSHFYPLAGFLLVRTTTQHTNTHPRNRGGNCPKEHTGNYRSIYLKKAFFWHLDKKKKTTKLFIFFLCFFLFSSSSLSREQQLDWLRALQAARMTAEEEACVLTVTWIPAGAPQGQQEEARGSVEVWVLQENLNRATPTPPRWQSGSPAPPRCAQLTKSSWQTWKLCGECWPAPELMSTSSQRFLDRWGLFTPVRLNLHCSPSKWSNMEIISVFTFGHNYCLTMSSIVASSCQHFQISLQLLMPL